MAVGGISVIITIMMIFVYLFYVVFPLFTKASIEDAKVTIDSSAAHDLEIAYVALDEYAEVALSVDSAGVYRFFRVPAEGSDGGVEIASGRLLDSETSVARVAASEPDSRVFALADAAGQVTVVRHDYEISYPDDVRLVSPRITYPLGEVTLATDLSVSALAVAAGNDEVTVVAADEDGSLVLVHAVLEESFLDESITVEQQRIELTYEGAPITHVAIDIDQREVFVADVQGELYYYDVQTKTQPTLIDSRHVVDDDIKITDIKFLSGGISLIVGDSAGGVAQWFPVRDENNDYHLELIRRFPSGLNSAVRLSSEYYRKGFVGVDAENNVSVFHATSEQRLLNKRLDTTKINAVAFAPRANAIIVADVDNRLSMYRVHNEHPEISFKSLWGEIWYESRGQPEYIWQSSSASSDFEPKFSLTPLTFGTIKAAFYAMMFAVPFAIFGAIYTAYFMSPTMRKIVKPSIEVMEALPTVILGFLAGLWLAPLVERNLPGVFLVMLLVPTFVVAASFFWSRLPEKLRYQIPEGWEAALLIPVVILAVAVAMTLSYPIERVLFAGDMPKWLSRHGIDYDQRNSLVVGLAMGFAVIPTIFSISEDAVFSVPKHLTTGSLALGATPWQTVIRVVLLTASPGIFSAVMIGLGRAVGETMIVLMATGNTPIMDANIFQGFRALSANIAVEMPESEVASTHYRILFLAALVLFLATFLVNTVAELVRQRLRERYSSL